jgi:hypothetical protein
MHLNIVHVADCTVSVNVKLRINFSNIYKFDSESSACVVIIVLSVHI